MTEKTLGQIACEAVSGEAGWAALDGLPAVRMMWEMAAAAVAAVEREACANACEAQADERRGEDWYVSGAMDCADAIRKRVELSPFIPRKIIA